MLNAVGQIFGWTVFVGTLVFPFHNQITDLFKEGTTTAAIETPMISEDTVPAEIESPKKVLTVAKPQTKPEVKTIETVKIVEVPVEKIVEVRVVQVPTPVQETKEVVKEALPVVEPVKEELRPAAFELINAGNLSANKPTHDDLKYLFTIEGGNCGMAGAYFAVKDQYGSYMTGVPVSLIRDTGDTFAIGTTTSGNGVAPSAWLGYRSPDTNTTHTFTVATNDTSNISETYEVRVGQSYFDYMEMGKIKYRVEKHNGSDVWVDENDKKVDPATKLCL